MDPHRWDDDTPPTGSQPYSQPDNGFPRPGRPNAYPQQPGEYGAQGFGSPDQTAPIPAYPYGPSGYGPSGYGDNQYRDSQYGDRRSDRPYRDRHDDGRYDDGRYDEDRYDADRYDADRYDDEFADESARPWYKMRSTVAVAVAAAVVLLLATTVWLIVKPGSSPTRQLADPATDSSTGVVAPGVSVSPSATTAAPTTQAAVPKPTAKKTTIKPRPTPTYKPPPAQLPPPPPAPVPTSSSCTQDPGPDASHSAVSAALASAGQQNYWSGVQPPTGFTPPLPAFSVPSRLMDAFAWAESTWTSTVISCDGGIGLMQLMSDNVTYLNQRFGTNLDVHTLDGNAQLGATYIEWLTMYFGLYYFGSYDLMNATAPIQTGGGTLSLLDVVIAAYNVGPAAVENDNGTPNDGSDDTLSIPNTSYVNMVETAYANQPWLND